MNRKVVLWTVLALFSAASLLFTLQYFSRGFPIVSLDLEMDRKAALTSAAEWADRMETGPDDFSQAASFGLDRRVQNYTELEVGGTSAYRELLSGSLYSPYRWTVRHFREGDTNEARFWFTPAGDPYGFREELAEDEPGAVLPAWEARRIAEGSVGVWNVDLAEYDLVEESQENRPGGRVDHTFVYERRDETLGEAPFRLHLTISGDRLTELRHSVKVPESFDRMYEEMRSSNDLIATMAAALIGLLYLVGGCVIGLFFLLRQRWVLWRMPLLWAALIAGLQFLTSLNQLPLAWMNYDTALSAHGFLIQQVLGALGGALIMGVLFAVTFMAAESLTRRAFPGHLRFWELWSPGRANSLTVLGRTVAGYLLVPVFFAYEVALYFFSSEVLGWWSPTDALIQPDTLATYFPWLTSIAISTQAGFWEECLFRAVPIAGAALIGRRLGGERFWIAGAFVLQALIFGAGHANYAAQPSYARMVELIIPSLAFGLLYLVYGLLPAIVLHFAFDVVWFALPIMVSSSSGIWWDRILVVALSLVPLWIVLFRRWKRGKWESIGEEGLNRSWEPQQESEAAPALETEIELPGMSPGLRRSLIAAGGLGLLLWIWFAPRENQALPLGVGRHAAESRAVAELERRGVDLSEEWVDLSRVEVPLNENDRFIWQEGGEALYEELMGSYLSPPFWQVRFVRFTGAVEERAEEYRLQVQEEGAVVRFRHELPEQRPGATLEEGEARGIAEDWIRRELDLETAQIRLVLSEPSKLPNRRDWLFHYAVDEVYPLQKGEARIAVELAGDQVVDGYRFIDLPEDWERSFRSRRNLFQIVEMTGLLFGVIVLLAGAVWAVVRWSRGHHHVPTFWVLLLVTAILATIRAVNLWPSLEAGFSTAQPYTHQAFGLVIGTLLSSLFLGALVALVAGMVHANRQRQSRLSWFDSVLLGLSLGILASGLMSVLSRLLPSLLPPWASYQGADASWPILAVGLSPLNRIFVTTAFLLLVVFLSNRLMSQGTRRQGRLTLILAILGFFLAASFGVESWWGYLLGALALALFLNLAYWAVFRFGLASIPWTAVGFVLLQEIGNGFSGAFPGAFAGMLVAVVLLFLTAFLWSRFLIRET